MLTRYLLLLIRPLVYFNNANVFSGIIKISAGGIRDSLQNEVIFEVSCMYVACITFKLDYEHVDIMNEIYILREKRAST